MNTEIEMKAWVDDFDLMDSRLRECGAEFKRDYSKSDRYLHQYQDGEYTQEVRIRFDGSEAVVTQKQKTVENGLESNVEREFSVSHAENFLHLLETSGYRYFIDKVKIGRAYIMDDFLIELSRIEDLGVFIEIEKVFEGPVAPQIVKQTEARIRKCLAILGISDSAIEQKAYTRMLAEKRGVRHPLSKLG